MKNPLTIMATAGLFAFASATAEAAPIGLVAYYDFEGTGGNELLDRSGSGLHLTNHQNSVQFVTDASGAAGSTQVASFGNGGSSTLYFDEPDSSPLWTENYTVSFWIKADEQLQSNTNIRLISTRHQSGLGNNNWRVEGFGKRGDPGSPLVRALDMRKQGMGGEDGATDNMIWTPAPALSNDGDESNDEWYHVAFTANTSDPDPVSGQSAVVVQTWVNGSLVGTQNWTLASFRSMGAADGGFLIGAETVTGGRHFVGLLDDIAIFNRALTQAEIEGIANGTIALIPEPASLVLMGMGLVMLRRRR